MPQVILQNGQIVPSSGQSGPGSAECEAAEGQALVDAGYATWAPEEGP